jgi:hypothetical protein
MRRVYKGKVQMDNREIDKLIHTRVMQQKGIASRYTEEIDKAWSVIKKMRQLG